jgi:hypothetical protein
MTRPRNPPPVDELTISDLTLLLLGPIEGEAAPDDEGGAATGLFEDGSPTDLALCLYAEEALSAEEILLIEEALERSPEVSARLARVTEIAEARREACLRRILGSGDVSGDLVLEVQAGGMRLLFEPKILALAAAEVRGGTVQTNDRKALVCMSVTEHFDATSHIGALHIKIETHRDRRLVDADGRFEVLVGGTPHAVFPVEVRGRKFDRSFSFEKLSVSSANVRFRLVLILGDS